MRIDFHVAGTITEGPYAGAAVAWSVKGFAGDTTTMPPLEAWFDPDFVPDMDVALRGTAWFQTMDPSHAYLNHTVLAIRGTVNLATGRFRAMAWSLAD